MKTLALAVFAAATLVALPSVAMAASCYDLWYARNKIYADNGYCFQTQLGMETFDNSNCWTTHPRLSKWEQKQVADIQYQEKIQRCHVN